MAAVYDNFGISFSYPENWKLVEEQAQEWPRSASVYSPSDAFWNVTVHPDDADLREAVDAVVTAMDETYDDFEYEATTETFADYETFGCNMHFYCLDMLVQAQVRAFEFGDAKVLVMFQGEDREFDRLRQVFSAITHDLVRRQAAA
ncbi:hypothetical protein [Blastopirellula marina]|uniref:Uncharacterized protein n=1 Tax=Blastopirellula marina TaxID=124 RepID=A0A2S8FWE0_9BACT|nr:hypothetical protein [Blastopirellula marina]PQO36496.1 hypothetical protein C5Y98_12405 [Blastopirellula marina]PQO47446.1 hypothetical protein C5Y93_05220 [Blastopirellula marina]PTL44333.1 hypothetical protein C5Y97_12415 [Blastopirellula marina]